MTKKCVVWDKTSPINGVDAEMILSNRPWTSKEDVILLLEDERVTNIEQPSILKASLGLSDALSPLEIGTKYMEYLENQNKEQVTQQQDLQSQINDINNALASLIGGE